MAAQREAVVILVPVLNRPHHVERLMADVDAVTSKPYRLLFLVDEGDTNERGALRAAGADHLVVPRARRRYACKINDGIRESDEPLIFMAADDVHFTPGWLPRAAVCLTYRKQVIGTKDGGVNPRVASGEHSVHTLLTRRYAQLGSIDDPNVVLHEGYPHEYVDDEFIGTAKLRGAFLSSSSVVEHLHPYLRLSPIDSTYRKGWAGRSAGKRLVNQRQHLWASTS